MNRREHSRRKLRRQYLAALACDAEPRTEDGLRCCGTHGHDQSWPNDSQLRFQPRPADCDFARVWFLMNPAFAARLPFEMFYRIRDVNLRPIDSSFLERAIHDFSSGTNEGFTRDVFVVAGLFANQHHRSMLRTFAKHGLGATFVEIACRAVSCCFAHRAQTCRIRRLRWSGGFLGAHRVL